MLVALNSRVVRPEVVPTDGSSRFVIITMKYLQGTFVLALFLCVSVSPAAADSPPVVTQEQVRALALARSPLVKLIDAEYAVSVGSAMELAVLNNPSLSTETQFSAHPRASTGDNQIVASIDQPLRLSDFGSRSRVAALMNRTAQDDQKLALLELTQRIHLLYVKLWSEREQLEQLDGVRRKASKKLTLAESAASRGLVTSGEKQLIEGEVGRLKAQILGIRSVVAQTESELLKISGCDLARATLEPPELKAPPALEALLKIGVETDLNPLQRARRAAELAREQVRLAELDRISTITPRVVYEHTNDGSDFFGVGITVPLAIWDRNQGQRVIAAARDDQRRAELDMLSAGALEKHIEMLQRASQTSYEQAQVFKSQVLPSFRGALESQEREFQSGKGSILQLWQSLRALSEAQEQELSLRVRSAEVLSQLSLFVGQEVQ